VTVQVPAGTLDNVYVPVADVVAVTPQPDTIAPAIGAESEAFVTVPVIVPGAGGVKGTFIVVV
jgi:hypothetical protein